MQALYHVVQGWIMKNLIVFFLFGWPFILLPFLIFLLPGFFLLFGFLFFGILGLPVLAFVVLFFFVGCILYVPFTVVFAISSWPADALFKFILSWIFYIPLAFWIIIDAEIEFEALASLVAYDEEASIDDKVSLGLAGELGV